ncbi:acyl transferase/acyl hydrolase/lysophospholipase [Thelonectria olida]|uniref:Acyl transferase/acyl hydrolase/lysophospholipase n=1 Tax=Thelonectria olida TaxID=1576542 RepID=A0A9P8W1I8_9HYPO|nr:acyl transferase/acyl hydrolase/lysophospholipase [Thelonectria olida]
MPSSCSHWVWNCGERHPAIATSRRLREVTASLAPQSPNPSLIIVTGCRQRPSCSPKPRRHPGQLCLDLDITDSSQPLLIGTTALSMKSKTRVQCCVPEKEESIPSITSSLDAEIAIYAQLLYRFVDVFCFFSYNMEDLGTIARRVAYWMERRSHVESTLRPSLLLVLSDTHWRQTNATVVAFELFKKYISSFASQTLETHFSRLDVIQMPNNVSHTTFRSVLAEHAGAIRQHRRETANLFSIEHFNELFERAWDSMAINPKHDFDFICGARQDRPVAADMTTHLSNFMNQVKLAKELRDFVAPVIASSILIDNYPPGMHLRIRPPTAGYSILCIDGGGVRGIVPPTVLKLIEERLGLPIPIQEHFTHAYGVSAGALIILALFVNGWPVERCAVEFEELAKVAFHPRPIAGLPILNWIYSILSGSFYSERGIEGALRRVFGSKKITDMCYANTIGAKVGIPAASILQPSTCLFTNYNGIGKDRTGYYIPKDCEAVKIWEVFFAPKYIPGLGTFQDAGVLQNNPTLIALSEFVALEPRAKLDLILNVGTGSSPGLPLENSQPRVVEDSWLARLYRAYMSLIQGQKTWNDCAGLAKEILGGGTQYRLDITLHRPPSLDDFKTMPTLKTLVHRDKSLSKVIDKMACRLFANLFYFELDALPRKTGAKFFVRGKIYCLRKEGDQALREILHRFRKCTILINGKPVPLNTGSDRHPDPGHNFTFSTSEDLLIELRESGSRQTCPLSGSPYKISKLVSSGCLRAVFGTRTHKRKATGEIRSLPERGRKLRKVRGRERR